MRVISPSMHNFINRASIECFGKSYDEAISESQKAISEKLEAQKVVIRSIISLHDKMSLNAEQIANMLDIEVDFVSEVLEKYENEQN